MLEVRGRRVGMFNVTKKTLSFLDFGVGRTLLTAVLLAAQSQELFIRAFIFFDKNEVID